MIARQLRKNQGSTCRHVSLETDSANLSSFIQSFCPCTSYGLSCLSRKEKKKKDVCRTVCDRKLSKNTILYNETQHDAITKIERGFIPKRQYFFKSLGTLLMTLSNKYQHCRVLKRGSKTGQQIDAPVKYVADYKYLFLCIYQVCKLLV